MWGETEDEDCSASVVVGNVAERSVPAGATERRYAAEAGQGERRAPDFLDGGEEVRRQFVAADAHQRQRSLAGVPQILDRGADGRQVLIAGNRAGEGGL